MERPAQIQISLLHIFCHPEISYIQTVKKRENQFFLLFFLLFSFECQVIRQLYLTDRLLLKLREKENSLHCGYLNEFNMVVSAFTLQCNEAKNWYDGFNKARQIYMKLKQDSVNNNHNNTSDNLSNRKSPLGSSIGWFRDENFKLILLFVSSC